jgi:2-dehydropantoate 2-reductase
MRILIVGAGGVGGYIAAQIIRKTAADTVLVARGDHLRSIVKNGLTIEEGEKRYSIDVETATDNPSRCGVFDLIIVSVKAPQIPDALELISNNINNETVILPLLNGIDHDLKIAARFPDADLLKGCIYILSNIVRPGVVRKIGPLFRLCWGRRGFDPAKYSRISNIFDEAGMRHKATGNIEYEIWKKYLFISPMGLLTAHYGKSMDRIASEHLDELSALMHEILSVANRRSIGLNEKNIEEALEQALKVAPGAKTSLQIDMENGKAGELETLGKYIIDEAQRLGISVPATSSIFTALTDRYQI